ncbi:hypothetical protein [Secundilactobacillus folii]|uniref:hypothetical protein n=1 Tax=Secundilactobacillus folii TaxID=2678357 RepID=UPI001563C4D4|nr:hypothetical protein [Secundilactobacillus folii]
MPKGILWLILILNIVLIGLLFAMKDMLAMWLMAIIMTVESLGSLYAAYHR